LNPIQEHRNVAGPVDDLRILLNEFGWDVRNQLPTAVATARAKDRMDIRAAKHLEKLAKPAFARSGEITERRNDIGAKICFESQVLELAAALFQQFLFYIAGRRHYADRVAGFQSFGFDHGATNNAG